MRWKLTTITLALVTVMGMAGCGNAASSAANSSAPAPGASTSTASVSAQGTESQKVEIGAQGEGLKILISSKNMADPFHSWLCNSTVTALTSKYPKAEYTIVDLMADPANTQALIDQAVLEGYNGLVLDKVSVEQNTDDMLKAAKEEGVYTAITNASGTGGGISSTSGAAQYDLGYTVGLRAAEGLPQNAKICVILSTPGDPGSEGRWQGYQDALKEKGRTDIQVLDVKNNDNWAKEKAMRIMDDWLQIYPEIDAVLGMNDGMVLGCIESCKADGRDVQKMQFYGIDGLGDACLSIQSGELTASVLQDAEDMGGNAIRMVVGMIKGEINPPEDYLITPVVIDSSNLEKYIAIHKANGAL